MSEFERGEVYGTNDVSVCPYCGSDDIDLVAAITEDDIDAVDNRINVQCHCTMCRGVWTNVYICHNFIADRVPESDGE